MSLVQPLCAKRTISKLKQIVQDASSSAKCLPGWRFPTSLDHNKLLPAFKVTRRLSSATAQAPRDTVCCDPSSGSEPQHVPSKSLAPGKEEKVS